MTPGLAFTVAASQPPRLLLAREAGGERRGKSAARPTRHALRAPLARGRAARGESKAWHGFESARRRLCTSGAGPWPRCPPREYGAARRQTRQTRRDRPSPFAQSTSSGRAPRGGAPPPAPARIVIAWLHTIIQNRDGGSPAGLGHADVRVARPASGSNPGRAAYPCSNELD